MESCDLTKFSFFSHWKDPFLTDFYFQIRARNFERVEKLFQRCLLKVLNIELWKTYLTYVKDTKASLANYK